MDEEGGVRQRKTKCKRGKISQFLCLRYSIGKLTQSIHLEHQRVLNDLILQ